MYSGQTATMGHILVVDFEKLHVSIVINYISATCHMLFSHYMNKNVEKVEMFWSCSYSSMTFKFFTVQIVSSARQKY